jgi:hypothetical protein
MTIANCKLIFLASMLLLAGGCAACPDRMVQPQFHNPFPQLYRIAVLPFYNQSAEPTVDGEAVALAYYNELQGIPGFEVMPVGVTKQLLAASQIEPRTGSDFQRLARAMNVDAVLVGSVTEYSPYYPPRIGLAVDWYAAKPAFHPVPTGYGLPWGAAEEEYIPSTLVQEAEFALAREQLKTQTPEALPEAAQASHTTASTATTGGASEAPLLPPDWPDPRGFVPAAPTPVRPPARPQYEPVISHVRVYNGHDELLTEKLANYYFFRDDARFGGWAAYLTRPEDFLRFCCYLHLTETLAARGGAGEGRVVWRWNIGRYDP